MPTDWSLAEVSATVADYLAMLESELRGEPYSKRQHNSRLQAELTNRSRGAIEFKHQNISAVMIELGFPYISGYKPLGNYQEILRDEVLAQLSANDGVVSAAEAIIKAPATVTSQHLATSLVFVRTPRRETPPAIRKRPAIRERPCQTNYLEKESRNRSLGLAGELFVMQIEHQRLWEAGAQRLAERIEHVALTRGDGLGYDLISFELDGRERLIEVKTTAFGELTPFFASANEVAVSDKLAAFHLYRVFNFRRDPKIYVLRGSLRQSCVLEPAEYKASPP